MDVKAINRLQHHRSHLDGEHDISDCVKNIVSGSGSPTGSALQMRSYCFARAMQAWFEFSDLLAMKQWLYLSGRFQVFYLELKKVRSMHWPESWISHECYFLTVSANAQKSVGDAMNHRNLCGPGRCHEVTVCRTLGAFCAPSQPGGSADCS